MTRPSTEAEETSPPSRARKAEWQYIVRSLGLATRAFHYFKGSAVNRCAPSPNSHESRRNKSHDWHVQPVVKDQIRDPPERCVPVERVIHQMTCPRNFGFKGSATRAAPPSSAIGGLHPCRASQSVKTREAEPFKSTAAFLDVSTEIKRNLLFTLIPDRMTSAFCDFAISKSRHHKIGKMPGCQLKIFSEVLATCKTLQSRVPLIRVIALNHPALAPGCLFIGLLSDVPGNASDSASSAQFRLGSAYLVQPG